MKFFEPGALVPPSQAFDAVASGALDAAWATPGFWTGKDIAFAVYSTVPFGPGLGEFLAWMKHGGGEQGMQALYHKYGIHSIVCHLIQPEASGWFRKEIKTLDDMKGLKMRFFGLGANAMQKLGVATQLLQAGEIFQARSSAPSMPPSSRCRRLREGVAGSGGRTGRQEPRVQEGLGLADQVPRRILDLARARLSQVVATPTHRKWHARHHRACRFARDAAAAAPARSPPHSDR